MPGAATRAAIPRSARHPPGLDAAPRSRADDPAGSDTRIERRAGCNPLDPPRGDAARTSKAAMTISRRLARRPHPVAAGAARDSGERGARAARQRLAQDGIDVNARRRDGPPGPRSIPRHAARSADRAGRTRGAAAATGIEHGRECPWNARDGRCASARARPTTSARPPRCRRARGGSSRRRRAGRHPAGRTRSHPAPPARQVADPIEQGPRAPPAGRSELDFGPRERGWVHQRPWAADALVGPIVRCSAGLRRVAWPRRLGPGQWGPGHAMPSARRIRPNGQRPRRRRCRICAWPCCSA